MTETPPESAPIPPRRPPGARPPKRQPSGAKVVSIAMLICFALAFALYASFPKRPPVAQPAFEPVPDTTATARARDAEAGTGGDKAR
jgi:hypothetical protein